MDGKYCVYKHTAPNGKVYIGITSRKPEKRWRHDGSGYSTSPHFHSAIKKYGWENIEHEILITGLTKDEAGEMERKMIEKYNSTDRRFGYNEKTGGEYGATFCDDLLKRMSDIQKKRFENPSERERMRKARLGKRASPEARKRMSEAKKGTHFEWTEEHLNLHREVMKKYYSDPANLERVRKQGKAISIYGLETAKKVIQFDDDMNIIGEYESLKASGRATGVRDGNICKCCQRKVKHAGGYVWRYASDISSAEKSINKIRT